MALRNSEDRYGAVAQALHWIMTAVIVGMFGLGLWMVSLTYYDPWYKTGPDLHKSIGILLLGALLVRLAWRLGNPQPAALAQNRWERAAALWVHRAFYLLLLCMMVSGYLISTADGRPISVFGLFEVPSVLQKKGLEDQAGEIHFYLACTTIGLAALHAAAALKHHFIDRDDTLRRMLPAIRWKSPHHGKEEFDL